LALTRAAAKEAAKHKALRPWFDTVIFCLGETGQLAQQSQTQNPPCQKI
jgi:hypothetical protein